MRGFSHHDWSDGARAPQLGVDQITEIFGLDE